jgi:hypothetical protein
MSESSSATSNLANGLSSSMFVIVLSLLDFHSAPVVFEVAQAIFVVI